MRSSRRWNTYIQRREIKYMESPHENLFKEMKLSRKEIEAGKIGLEKLAQKLAKLRQKDSLTPEEERLILHNSAVMGGALKEQARE